MWKNNNLSFFVIFLLLFSSSFTYSFETDTSLKIVRNALSGIVKSAGNMGVSKACKIALPAELCEIVIDPIMTAIYEEVPYLKPKESDTLNEVNQKKEFIIQYIEKNEKIQEMIIVKFAELGNKQELILDEIRKFGNNQEEIQSSLATLLSGQNKIEQKIDNIISSGEKEDSAQKVDRKNKILSNLYEYDSIVYKIRIMQSRIRKYNPDYPNIWNPDGMRAESEALANDVENDKLSNKELDELVLSTRKMVIFFQGVHDELKDDLAGYEKVR